MAVELYASIDRSKVDKLPFFKGTYPFGYVDTNDEMRLGIVYEVDAASAEKLKKLLAGKEDRKLVQGDRVFVLSGCKIPQFKIKEYLRTIGAVMVNNIEDATVFVGNKRVSKKCSDYDYIRMDSTSMIIDTVYSNTDKKELEVDEFKIDPVLNDYFPDLGKLKDVRLNKAACSNNSDAVTGSARYMQCITPYVARLAYEILSRKMITITEESLFNQLPYVAKLDKQLTEQLMMMMSSSDSDNHKTAHEILANSDWKDADLYLYTIAREHYYQLSSSRYKNIRLFREEARMAERSQMNEETFLREQLKQDKLTTEALELLLPLVADRVEQRVNAVNSSIFSIKIELKPEYENILGPHKFNKEVVPDKNSVPDED